MKSSELAPLLFTVYLAAASGRSPALPCFAAFLALVCFSGLFAFTQLFFQTRENMETITNYFASTYSIVVDDNIYSPNWIYYHTVDDYAVCGITADDIKDHISQYSNINFESNALSAFESKISNYIGESISFDGIGSDFIAEDTSNTTDIIG